MKRKNRSLVSALFHFSMLIGIGCFLFLWVLPKVSTREFPWDVDTSENFSVKLLRKKLLENSKTWPSSVHFDNNEYQISYTFNQQLTSYIIDLLRQFRSDYTSVAVIDNDTGNILSLVDYGREEGDMGLSLTFSGNHPSASLFKIVTSADLLQNTLIKKDSVFHYLGRSTTLYKYQLIRKNFNSWMRKETLMQAFARSNNVIFGKAALVNINKDSILNMAYNLGFQQDLMEEFALPLSNVFTPEDGYNLAELATGFNRKTTMTTVHGALLSLIIANNGHVKYPKIISEVRQKNQELLVWRPHRASKKILNQNVSFDLQEMMELTVKAGTAKKVYRGLDRGMKDRLRIGGKTGSITGGEPFGKRDWFTVYALPSNSANFRGPQKGISICVMIINVKKWYVKATFLARKIIEYYYKSIYPISKNVDSVS